MNSQASFEALLRQASGLLAGAETLAVLTGAGISAESGIPTFRDAGGLWDGLRPEDWASPEGFARDPERVWRWYERRRAELRLACPNAAHFALAELERRAAARGGQFVLATQNIDGLHHAAGSRNVLELHGTLTRMRCTRCPYETEIGAEPVEPLPPRCPDCQALLRPGVVWFGGPLPADVIQAAADAAANADVFLTVGTSAVVYPAAALTEIAVGCGAAAIEVNLQPTPASRLVRVALHGKAGDILPRLLAEAP